MAADSLTKRPEGYEDLLRELKERIRVARVQAALAVNRELVLLYWTIGRDILERQERLGWGAKVIDQLAADLRKEFPDLKYMRSLAEAWPDPEVVQQVVAQIPWGHNVRLFEKVSAPEKRLWYARKIVENGWNRNELVINIERELAEEIVRHDGLPSHA